MDAVLSSHLIADYIAQTSLEWFFASILSDWDKGSIHPDWSWPEKFASFFFFFLTPFILEQRLLQWGLKNTI